jgi:hypothetical protein
VAAALPSMALRTTPPVSSHRHPEHPMHAKWKDWAFRKTANVYLD